MKNEELFNRIVRLKTKNAVLLFFILYKNGVAKESELLKVFRMDAHSLRAVLSMLVNLNLAHFVLDNKNITYYMIDKQFFDKDSDFYNRLAMSEKNVKFINLCEGIKKTKTSEHKKEDEIVDFIKELYAKTFKGLAYPYSANVTKKFCQEMLLIFKKLVKSSVYDKTLKAYLEGCFKKMSESAGFNLRKISNMDRIIKFVDNRSEASISSVAVCDDYGMNCSYRDSEGCRLRKDGLSCSDKIREHMRTKYGFKV